MNEPDDGMVPLLTGMLAALLGDEHVSRALRRFDLTPNEARNALVVHFRETGNTYEIAVRKMGTFTREEVGGTGKPGRVVNGQ